eukprot:13926-Heterococcus_DN1.PRE.2
MEFDSVLLLLLLLDACTALLLVMRILRTHALDHKEALIYNIVQRVRNTDTPWSCTVEFA